MTTQVENFVGEWNVTVCDKGKMTHGDKVFISMEDEKIIVSYDGLSSEAQFLEGMLHVAFPNAETESLFRCTIAYYQQEWNGEIWRSIFCLTVDTDPNDAGVWGAEETGNPE